MKNQKGFIAIGLAVAVSAIVYLLISAIDSNMSLFMSAFNKNKAYYDSEVVIDHLGKLIREAHDLGRPIKPAISPLLRIPDPRCLRIGNLFFCNPVVCFDRADTRFKSPICIDMRDANRIRVINIAWNDRWESFKNAMIKTIGDLMTSSEAEAGPLDVGRPAIPTIPAIERTYLVRDPTLTHPFIKNFYTDFTCQLPTAAGANISQCVTFRFCTKLSGVCNDNELVIQTVILSDTPDTDVED